MKKIHERVNQQLETVSVVVTLRSVMCHIYSTLTSANHPVDFGFVSFITLLTCSVILWSDVPSERL